MEVVNVGPDDCVTKNFADPAARDALAEGLGALAAPFDQTPAAHASLMAALLGDYLRCCEAIGEAPDDTLLGPIAKKLNALRIGEEEAG